MTLTLTLTLTLTVPLPLPLPYPYPYPYPIPNPNPNHEPGRLTAPRAHPGAMAAVRVGQRRARLLAVQHRGELC